MSIFKERLLADQNVVITGGGSGIGLGIARRFAEHGARVGLIGRTQERLDGAVGLIGREGGVAAGRSADVRDYDAVAGAIKGFADEWGPIDIVVAGAAGNFPAPVVAMSANAFRSVIDIDLCGTFNTCRAAFEHLRKPGASVIAISATLATMPTPFQAHVCAAKAGIDSFCRSLALEWGPQGLRVNMIHPGPVEDTEGMKRLTPTDEARERLTASIPIKRYVTKDEIADLCLFLSSKAAQAITGATLVCDGGQSLGGSGALLSAIGLG